MADLFKGMNDREACDFQLEEWVKAQLVEPEILQKYTALHEAVQLNFRRNQNQPPTPFSHEKSELLKKLESVSVHGLSNAQLRVLDKVGITHNIGNSASIRIRELMTEHAADLSHIAEEIQKSNQELQNGTARLHR